MAYEVVRHSPQQNDIIALEEHQEQTPGSFFGGRPVLYLHCANAAVRITRADLASQPDFAALQDVQGSGEDAGQAEISGVGVWVTSKALILFSSAKAVGVEIPYPTISIHAQEGDAVLLELNLSDPNANDEDLEFLQLRIVPTSASSAHDEGQSNGTSNASSVRELYDAISACQELNPDPNPDGDDGEGGFDETAPGASGWITSENMADFMDENGNLRMPAGTTVIGGEEDEAEAGGEVAGLGDGAGRTRTAAERDTEDGAEDEAKWQRTG